MSFFSASTPPHAAAAAAAAAPRAPAASGSAYPHSPDPTLPDSKWLQSLQSHPIFDRTPPSSSSTAPTPATSSPNPRLMAVRNTDLILAADGNQLRMTSLLDAKSHLSDHPPSPSPSLPSPSTHSHLSYKLLQPSDASHIDFDVRQLIVNPTGKLLAVVGQHRVSLLVLPRSGYNKQVGAEIACRSVPVGPYYHSQHGTARIAKVQWHPWGEAGTSLLILTDDGLLREYDVSRDTEEPQQTVSLLPQPQASAAYQRSRSRSATPTAAALAASIYSSPAPARIGQRPAASPSRSRSATPGAASAFGLSAEDDESRVAVSFSLCLSQAPTAAAPTMFDDTDDQDWAGGFKAAQRADDWSAFTVLGLMKNGDVWAVCPFMPRNSMIPPSHIHALSRFTSLKLSGSGAQHESTESELQAEMQLRFLNALLKQVSDKSTREERQGSRTRSSATPGQDRFGRHRSTSTMDLDRLSEAPAGGEAMADEEGLDGRSDVPLRLHPPTWAYAEDLSSASAKNAPRPQGPFLLKPAPLELCDERESSACDIAYTWLDKHGPSTAEAQVSGLGIVSIVGHDGRVDVGVLLEPVEPKWGKGPSSNAGSGSLRRSTKPKRTNRYGLSDTEDEGDDSVALDLDSLSISASEELPTLLMYETIDLGMLDSVMEAGSLSQSQSSDVLLGESDRHPPCFAADPLYRDTLYVHHALGAQCLGFARWGQKLIDVLNLPSEEDLEAEATSSSPPSAQPISREKALTKLLHHDETTEVVWIVKTVTSGASGSLSLNPVTAVCIVSDVYLSYSLLVVTHDLQLVALELSLRISADDLVPPASTAADAAATTATSRTRAYVSLLGDGTPFAPPALFNQSGSLKGLPSQPRRAAASGSTPSSSEVKVSPETLRQLGKTVESFRIEIRDVVSAGNAVQARLDLQVREMTRMLDKLSAIQQRCERVSGAGGLAERLAQIRTRQHELTARTDRALQKLMDRHSPSLSVYENRWFDELGRIARDVGINGAEGGKGLVAKSELLQHHLDLLRPSLKAMADAQAAAAGTQRKGTRDAFSEDARASQQRGIGREQLRKVETLLGGEARLLAEAKEKVVELNGRIARISQGAAGGGAMLPDGGRGWRGSSSTASGVY